MSKLQPKLSERANFDAYAFAIKSILNQFGTSPFYSKDYNALREASRNHSPYFFGSAQMPNLRCLVDSGIVAVVEEKSYTVSCYKPSRWGTPIPVKPDELKTLHNVLDNLSCDEFSEALTEFIDDNLEEQERLRFKYALQMTSMGEVVRKLMPWIVEALGAGDCGEIF